MKKFSTRPPLETIIFLLVLFIPFVSTNLTYDPTIIKTTFIKIGLILILALYLIKSLAEKEIKVKKIAPLFFLFLLAGYLVINSVFKYPLASAEELFTTFLFFSFFLPSSIYPLALNLSRY